MKSVLSLLAQTRTIVVCTSFFFVLIAGCGKPADSGDATAEATPAPEATATPETDAPDATPASTPAAETEAEATPAAGTEDAAGAAAPAAPVELPDPVAVVNGEEISAADLEEAFNTAVGAAGIDPSALSADQKLAGYSQLLDDLIIDRLIKAESAGIEISDEEVAKEIEMIKGQFPSPEEFQAQLAQSGQDEAGLTEMIRDGMRQSRWVDEQMGDNAKVTDAEIQSFYDENPTEFDQPETVRASHILLMVPEDADEATVEAKKQEAMAALKRVQDGEDFTAVAKEVSEEPGASESGGDLDFFTKDRMVPEFAEAAFSMDVDDISAEPVKTQFGWHVIKVTDKKEAGKVEFEEVKPQLTAFLEGQKRQQAVGAVIENLRSTADVKVNLPAPTAPMMPPPGAMPQMPPLPPAPETDGN